MGSVLSHLSDGSGSFTVVFAGVVASVVVGLLKDPVGSWCARLSSGLGERRKVADHRRKQLIDALLADSTYFELARFRAVLACVVFGGSSLLHFCGPIMLAMQPASFVRSSVIWGVLAPCLGMVSIATAYRAARRVELINAATRELRLRQRLPKLP
jgi:hypothetical protein